MQKKKKKKNQNKQNKTILKHIVYSHRYMYLAYSFDFIGILPYHFCKNYQFFRRFFPLFSMDIDVNFQFTPKREISEK